jgi:hypothetical protein
MKTNANTRIRLVARFRLCGALLQNFAWLDRLSKSAPHKISQIHVAPSGSFDTDKHSIGSMNDARVLGNEAKRACVFRSIASLRKTKAGQKKQTLALV